MYFRCEKLPLFWNINRQLSNDLIFNRQPSKRILFLIVKGTRWRSKRTRKVNVYLRLRLARACVHFGRDQICMQVDASFSPFGHPTQVSAGWVTSINLLLANEIREKTCESVWPPNASFYASSTCCYFGYLRVPFSDLWRVSRKARKLFGLVKPNQNLEPYDYRDVLFTYS